MYVNKFYHKINKDLPYIVNTFETKWLEALKGMYILCKAYKKIFTHQLLSWQSSLYSLVGGDQPVCISNWKQSKHHIADTQ